MTAKFFLKVYIKLKQKLIIVLPKAMHELTSANIQAIEKTIKPNKSTTAMLKI
jgi:hypothetical protein